MQYQSRPGCRISRGRRLILGSSILYHYWRTFEINDLAVDPAYQRQGIAEKPITIVKGNDRTIVSHHDTKEEALETGKKIWEESDKTAIVSCIRGKVVKEDAPEEVKKSYEIYLKQLEEKEDSI